MIRSKWLTGEDDLSAVRRLRQTPDDGRDGSALHVLVYEDDADLAAGRLYDNRGRFYIDGLALAPGADPELLVLAVQLMVYRATEFGAKEIYSPESGAARKLLLAAGFLSVPPGEDPYAALVLRPSCGHDCSSCACCHARESAGEEPER